MTGKKQPWKSSSKQPVPRKLRRKEYKRDEAAFLLKGIGEAGEQLDYLAANVLLLKVAERQKTQIEEEKSEAKGEKRRIRKKLYKSEEKLSKVREDVVTAQLKEEKREAKREKRTIKAKLSKLEKKLSKLQGKYRKLREDVHQAVQKVTARQLMVDHCVVTFQDYDQLAYKSHQQKRMIEYLREHGWEGSSSCHPEFDSQDEADEEVCECAGCVAEAAAKAPLQ